MSINNVYQHLQSADEELKRLIEEEGRDERLIQIRRGIEEIEKAVFAYGNSLDPTG